MTIKNHTVNIAMQLQHLLCEDVTFDFVNFAVEICSHSNTGAVVGSVIILRGKALSAVGVLVNSQSVY